ncbi:MAG: hypothetical protein NT150_10790, partial [Bacteroidetes bacterium]|nr:hypothetical protein [Bacteroidota bacterium]
ELTRLFGNQVGYNVHYKKNTTIDPNGQVSVSYMNMGGKVVATGLAGAKPNNVSELSGDKTKTIHTDLFGMDGSTNTLSLDKLNKSYSSKFTVAAKTNYKFDYTAVLGAYDLNCVLDPAHPNTVSLDGAVDLTIQLIDGCGAVVFTENRNTNKGYTGANQSMTMNKAGVQLNQGEYQLTKKLSINEDKLDQYWKEYLANDSLCVRSEKEFIDEEMAKVDTFGCGLTCDQCQKEMQKLLAANPLVSTEEELRILGICDGLCDKTIGCSNYVAAMAGDMSPGGQYAELRKQKVQLDATASASFDDDGNPIVTKPDIKLNNADGAYDAGNPADDVVDATPFPMSILNSSNSLPVPAFLKAAPLSLSSASWKNPIQITVAAFLGYNTHNEVLYATDISFNSATYSITNYKGRDGKIFYVQVIKDGSTYKPAISDASQLILVDANTNLYKIPVKYLSNIADFEKYWQPQWGNYLVPYHPEYGYLLDCYNNYKSYDFDYTLSGTSTLSDAIGKGYLDNVGATTNLLAMDPFTPAGSVNRAYLNASQTDFKSFGTTHYSMIKMANVAANCPRANENLNYCGTTTCGDDKINTTEEWNIYKAFYLSEKQVLIRQRATRRAVNNNYYNGCIGEENFLTTDEAAPFRAYQLVGTTQYSQCRPIWGWSILGYDCSNPIVWTYNTYMPAYLNPNQVCFIDRAPRFKKKTKRFFPMAPASSPAGQMGLHCKKLVSDENGVQEYVSIPCDNDIKSSMDAVITEGQRFKYESCGLCPMASDVESFVMNVMKQKEYSTAPSTHVNCPADKLQLGEVLSRQLTNDNTLNQDMSWTASLSADHKTMTGNIFSGSNTLANFTLNIPNNVRAKLDSLKDFCCLNVDGPNSFSFKATAVSKFSKRDTVFYISGTTSLRIDTCYIPPKCYLTEDSKRVAFFLNSLATRGGDKSSDLNTVGATKNLYGSTFLNAYYSNAVRGVTGYDNDMVQGAYIEDIPATTPKWISTAAGGKLEGTLSYTWNSDVHEVVINISDLLSGYLFEDVVEFSNVRPLSGESQKFYVDAKFVSAQGVEGYDTVIVEVPSLNPVVCKNPVAGKIY